MISDEPAVLLTDEQMRRFITNGYIAVKADYPPEFHADVRSKLSDLLDGAEGQHGNNLLPYVPQVQQVWQHPNVRGALQSVLGQDYVMHPHRYMHATQKGNTDIKSHQDGFMGGWQAGVRNPRSWWLIAMYYPNDVEPQDGPTAVLPGRQFLTQWQEAADRDLTQVYGCAGTCFLMHFNQWHAATIKSTPGTRMVLKFPFGRMVRPTTPAWDCTDVDWRPPRDGLPPYTHQLIWREQWNWLAGKGNGRVPLDGTGESAGKAIEALQCDEPRLRAAAADELGMLGPAAAEHVSALATRLQDQDEAVSLNAAYALAAIGPAALDRLVDTLAGDDQRTSRHAAFALGTMGRQAVGPLVDAAKGESPTLRSHAAIAMGNLDCSDEQLIVALAKAVKDVDPEVRCCAIESLGQHCSAARAAVPELIDALQDNVTETYDRRHRGAFGCIRPAAALALGRIGPEAAAAVPALSRCLPDSKNRYVTGFGVEALHRIGTDQATDVLVDYLKSTRFCPISLDPAHPY